MNAFNFFMSANLKEIYELGWRFGEKRDSFIYEDFKEMLDALEEGMKDGSYCAWVKNKIG